MKDEYVNRVKNILDAFSEKRYTNKEDIMKENAEVMLSDVKNVYMRQPKDGSKSSIFITSDIEYLNKRYHELNECKGNVEKDKKKLESKSTYIEDMADISNMSDTFIKHVNDAITEIKKESEKLPKVFTKSVVHTEVHGFDIEVWDVDILDDKNDDQSDDQSDDEASWGGYLMQNGGESKFEIVTNEIIKMLEDIFIDISMVSVNYSYYNEKAGYVWFIKKFLPFLNDFEKWKDKYKEFMDIEDIIGKYMDNKNYIKLMKDITKAFNDEIEVEIFFQKSIPFIKIISCISCIYNKLETYDITNSCNFVHGYESLTPTTYEPINPDKDNFFLSEDEIINKLRINLWDAQTANMQITRSHTSDNKKLKTCKKYVDELITEWEQRWNNNNYDSKYKINNSKQIARDIICYYIYKYYITSNKNGTTAGINDIEKIEGKLMHLKDGDFIIEYKYLNFT